MWGRARYVICCLTVPLIVVVMLAGVGIVVAAGSPMPAPMPEARRLASPTVSPPTVPDATPAPLPARQSPSPSAGTPSTPAAVALGAYISGAPWDPTKIDAFTALVGVAPPVVMWYQDWEHPGVREFDPVKMNAVASRGAVPVLTWNPWDDSGSANQPAYALRTITAGDHDPFIRQWARDAAAWRQPFYLRFAPEMNGDWFPWSPGVNGNTVSDYVAAWRHVVDIFRQEGATNAAWVWCPNVTDAPQAAFTPLYPGDGYVDWVALDGYNWGASQPGDPYKHWLSFADIFGPSYDALTALTSKPVMIAEVASTELGGDKAAWMTHGLLTDLPARFPRVRMVIWFDENKETDWRVDSSATSLASYRAIARAPLYTAQPVSPVPAPRG
jgi:hypothetical protein